LVAVVVVVPRGIITAQQVVLQLLTLVVPVRFLLVAVAVVVTAAQTLAPLLVRLDFLLVTVAEAVETLAKEMVVLVVVARLLLPTLTFPVFLQWTSLLGLVGLAGPLGVWRVKPVVAVKLLSNTLRLRSR
jgi:hypothetical protein